MTRNRKEPSKKPPTNSKRNSRPKKDATGQQMKSNVSSKSAKRASMSLEELRQLRQRQALEKRRYRAKLSQDKLNAERERDKERKRQMRSQLIALAANATEEKGSSAQVTKQKKIWELTANNEALGKRLYRAKMSAEQLEAIRERDRIRKRLARSRAQSKEAAAAAAATPVTKEQTLSTRTNISAKATKQGTQSNTASKRKTSTVETPVQQSPRGKENKVFLKFSKINKITKKVLKL